MSTPNDLLPNRAGDVERLLREVRADRDELRDRLTDALNALGPAECAAAEYRAACNAVARERDAAVHAWALAEDALRTALKGRTP